MISTIYISHDGMTDPLGGSQVIPYLTGLAKEYSIHLVSFEKKSKSHLKEGIENQLRSVGISWYPLTYRNTPPVISTILDIRKAAKLVREIIQKEGIQIIHCRSYIGALIGKIADPDQKCKHIFDMRGFWPDERVDGKIWKMKNPVHRMVYSYFKNFEKKQIPLADQVVVLTHAAKEHLNSRHYTRREIKVIPCAADLEHFKYAGDVVRDQYRNKLGIQNKFALCYLGSIGSWYLLSEMFDFFIAFNKLEPESKFIIFSPDDAKHIYDEADKKSIPREKLFVREAYRDELPALLSAMDAGIFFIKPCFSKLASSPTKHGELLGVGLNIVCNSKVGDIDRITTETGTGVVVNEFGSEELSIAAANLKDSAQKSNKELNRNAAKIWYSLEKGIASYKDIYDELSNS